MIHQSRSVPIHWFATDVALRHFVIKVERFNCTCQGKMRGRLMRTLEHKYLRLKHCIETNQTLLEKVEWWTVGVSFRW